jgi:hypothetical protein
MAQSLASIPYIGEAGGLRDWESPAFGAEIPPIAIWSWHPVAPAISTQQPPQQRQASQGAATRITQVLTAWRAAENRLQGLLEASPMRTIVRSEVERLRAEYQRLFALAIR